MLTLVDTISFDPNLLSNTTPLSLITSQEGGPLCTVDISAYDDDAVCDRHDQPSPSTSPLKTRIALQDSLSSDLPEHLKYTCGFSYAKGCSHSRKITREDSHTLIVPFNGVPRQGFFAVFDGHGGKEAADWCTQHFHEVRPPSSPGKHAG